MSPNVMQMRTTALTIKSRLFMIVRVRVRMRVRVRVSARTRKYRTRMSINAITNDEHREYVRGFAKPAGHGVGASFESSCSTRPECVCRTIHHPSAPGRCRQPVKPVDVECPPARRRRRRRGRRRVMCAQMRVYTYRHTCTTHNVGWHGIGLNAVVLAQCRM